MRDHPIANQLLDNGVDSVAVLTPDWTLEYWSEAMAALSGVSSRDALGRRLQDLAPMVTGTEVEQVLSDAFRGSAGRQPPPFFLARDAGLAAEHEWYVIPLPRGDRVHSVALVSRSLTRRGDLASQLAETEQRFRSMADCSPVLLWMSGTDSLCNFFNSTWLQFSGRTLEQELGVGWVEGVHAEDLESCLATYNAAFARREGFEIEYRLRRYDGEYRWILDRGAPRWTPSGEFAGFIGSCVDITDRRNAEERTRGLAQDLARANEHMERLLRATSHDLREPVRMVGAFLERLEAHLGGDLDEAGQRYLRRAAEGATRMGELVASLSEFARLRARPAVLEVLDLSQLVQDALADLAVAVEAAQASVVVDPLPAIPGDALALRRLFQNLLENALKFRGAAPVRVHVSCESRAADIVVSIQDNGIGFEPEYAERIFEMFQRLNERDRYSGMGVGLALARDVVDRHGGRIWAEGQPGNGATFRFTLPRTAKDVRPTLES